MSRRTANVIRALTLILAVVAVALLVRMLRPGDPTTTPDPRAGETAVDQAIAIAGREPLIVRGYVFDGPGGLGLRLCNGRQNGSPPRCLGPFIDLDGVNQGSFALEEGETDDGPVRWTEEPLALRGVLLGTRMRVTEVLR